MINPDEFDGGLRYGPKTFAEVTGRNRVWSVEPHVVDMFRRKECPVCGVPVVFGKEPYEHLWDKCDGVNDWEYVRCNRCGAIYTANPPTPEALERVYKSFPAQQEWLRTQQNEVELALDRKKFQWGLEMAGWPFGDRRILDIGCSTGTLLEVAGEMADNSDISTSTLLAGEDVNTDALEIAGVRLRSREWRHALMVIRTIPGLSPWKDGFDLVVLWEVLEHVLDPLAMLKRAAGFLAPGGKMLICVPNADSLAVKILHEKAPVFGLGHLQIFSADTLNRLFARAEIGLKSVEYISIISWYKEIANWLTLHGWNGADGPAVPPQDFLLPSPEHIREGLLGYKLVCLVEKAL